MRRLLRCCGQSPSSSSPSPHKKKDGAISSGSIFTGWWENNRIGSSFRQPRVRIPAEHFMQIQQASREPREFGIEVRRGAEQAGNHELEGKNG